MPKFLTLSKQIVLLLLCITVFLSLSQATSVNHIKNADMSASEDDDEAQHQRRTYNLNKLRHFLLTSNAEQRAAKREMQNFQKRKMIQEYFQALSDPDSNRLEKMKKRIKSYCNSYEDVMNSDLAACG